jgi:hypothetical protein
LPFTPQRFRLRIIVPPLSLSGSLSRSLSISALLTADDDPDEDPDKDLWIATLHRCPDRYRDLCRSLRYLPPTTIQTTIPTTIPTKI